MVGVILAATSRIRLVSLSSTIASTRAASPSSNALPEPNKGRTTLYAPGPGTVAMSPTLSSPAGSNAPVPTVSPYLTVNCFIALQGVFPPRT